MLAGLAAALVAGVLLTFSDFAMRSFAKAGPAAGAEAMKQINGEIIRSLFMVLFLGSALVAVGVLIYAWLSTAGPLRAWLTAGPLAYLLGVMAVTIVRNIPLNNELDRVDVHTEPGQEFWASFVGPWTRWNHVRTVGSLVTAFCYLQAALLLSAV